MQVALVGGTGFLGSHLRKELSSSGFNIKLISIENSRKKTTASKPAKTSPSASVNSPAELSAALAGCDAIVYLSGINREVQPGDFTRVHVEGLRLIINEAKNQNIEKLVYISFLRARADPTSNYLQSKWDGECLLRQSPLDYTILKPGICFGAGDQMISSIVRGLGITPMIGMFATVGIKEASMRPIYAGDMAKIIKVALTDIQFSRKSFAVVGPESFTMSEAVRRVSKALGKKVFFLRMPVTTMFAGAWVLERLSKNALVTVSQIRMLADGLSEPTEEAVSLPVELQPKTYFTEQEIQLAIASIR